MEGEELIDGKSFVFAEIIANKCFYDTKRTGFFRFTIF